MVKLVQQAYTIILFVKHQTLEVKEHCGYANSWGTIEAGVMQTTVANRLNLGIAIGPMKHGMSSEGLVNKHDEVASDKSQSCQTSTRICWQQLAIDMDVVTDHGLCNNCHRKNSCGALKPTKAHKLSEKQKKARLNMLINIRTGP